MKRNLEGIGIIIAFAALIVGVLSWLSPFTPVGNSPLSTDGAPNEQSTPEVQQNQIPTPNVSASSQFSTLVFSDDFENGNKNFMLGGGSGSFNIADESTGNKVLELSDAGSNSLLITFGPQNISDFAIEYRVKIVSLDSKQGDSGIVNLFLRYTVLGGPMYALSLDPYNQGILFYYYPPFEEIDGPSIKIETGKWYDIRVEVDGENLFASFDGVPVIKTKDSRLNSGNLGFQIYSNTTIDLDDVKVWTR